MVDIAMEILKLKPVFKDYIWGGTRLHTDYGFETGFDKTAEGWMLACHKDGMNTIEGGVFDKMTLQEVIDKEGLEKIGGKNCLKSILTPSERTVTVNQDSRTLLGRNAAFFELFDNNLAGIKLILTTNFLLSKPSCARNGTVCKIGVSCAVGRNISACLRP